MAKIDLLQSISDYNNSLIRKEIIDANEANQLINNEKAENDIIDIKGDNFTQQFNNFNEEDSTVEKQFNNDEVADNSNNYLEGRKALNPRDLTFETLLNNEYKANKLSYVLKDRQNITTIENGTDDNNISDSNLKVNPANEIVQKKNDLRISAEGVKSNKVKSNDPDGYDIGNFPKVLEPTDSRIEELIDASYKEELDQSINQVLLTNVVPYIGGNILSRIRDTLSGASSFNAQDAVGLVTGAAKNVSLVMSIIKTHTPSELIRLLGYNFYIMLLDRDLTTIKDPSNSRRGDNPSGTGLYEQFTGAIDLKFGESFGGDPVLNFINGMLNKGRGFLRTGNKGINQKKVNGEIVIDPEDQTELLERRKQELRQIVEDGVEFFSPEWRSSEKTFRDYSSGSEGEGYKTISYFGLWGEGNTAQTNINTYEIFHSNNKKSVLDKHPIILPFTTENIQARKEQEDISADTFDITKLRFYRNNYKRKDETISYSQRAEALFSKMGGLLNSNKLGYLHIKPKNDEVDEIYGQYKIPFQFNPIVSENASEARYAAINILNRVGELQTYTGTSQMAFSLETDYVILSDGSSESDTEIFGGYEDFMDEATLENMQMIEDMWRSLVLPYQSTERNLFIPPPIIRVFLGGNIGADNIDDNLKQSISTESYSNFLTFPDASNSEKRYLRKFICTSVQINKDFETMPFVFKDGKIEDMLGFKVSASFLEVDPSYDEQFSLPDFNNYMNKVAGLRVGATQ